eukprot:8267187-Prorocentrum_lima.AAC.2
MRTKLTKRKSDSDETQLKERRCTPDLTKPRAEWVSSGAASNTPFDAHPKEGWLLNRTLEGALTKP